MKQYYKRDIEELDDYGAGNHYFKHVEAMTGENLSGKSDICAELGVRDAKIELLMGIVKALDENVYSNMLIPEFNLAE